jgi:hypothetical protein
MSNQAPALGEDGVPNDVMWFEHAAATKNRTQP